MGVKSRFWKRNPHRVKLEADADLARFLQKELSRFTSAGTVSGAPKVRVLEIISGLESSPRGAYGGMVGYFGFDGNMDPCLTDRTMVGHGNTFIVQAGAGIVADSDPTAEFQETVYKATAMLRVIEMAESNQ